MTEEPWLNFNAIKIQITFNPRVLKFFRVVADLVEVEIEVTLRPTVSLGVRPPSGTRDQFFFLLDIFFRHLRVVVL
jgi:hypothetical protein